MPMDKSAADSYVYAKASAKLAKAYIGNRAQKLYDQSSLKDLWALLFTEEIPQMPQNLLAQQLEEKAEKEFISSYIKLLSNYSNPEKICVSLLHYYDYENLKELAAALILGKRHIPHVVDISPFNLLDFSAWPDLSSITKNSFLSWYREIPLPEKQMENDSKLDSQYINELFKSAEEIKGEAKKEVLALLKTKFSMENIIWALRLKIFYKFPSDIISNELAYSTSEKKADDEIVKDALKILNWDTDDYSKWSGWKYSRFLNPNNGGEVWQCDPVYLSHKFKQHYVHMAEKLFHKLPFTVCPLVSWFILKREELDNIRTATESLRLNIKM